MDARTAKLTLKALKRSAQAKVDFDFEIDNYERAELINLVRALEVAIEALEKSLSGETE